MSTVSNDQVLSESIRRYKRQLECVPLRGVLMEEKAKDMVRIMLEGQQDGPPVVAEISKKDVADMESPDKENHTVLHIKRGVEYNLVVTAVGGMEDDIPYAVTRALASAVGAEAFGPGMQ
ncbi:MAG: hypothetical protein JEZ02_08810 [Desulfatibacillum sp.]|nr:hypothetical protein [Desulfatibacillum sp.]